MNVRKLDSWSHANFHRPLVWIKLPQDCVFIPLVSLGPFTQCSHVDGSFATQSNKGMLTTATTVAKTF